MSRDADETAGTAHWVAHYQFAQTGRPVVNDVHSRFRFVDGLIAEQVDEFDFHRWSRQALGVPGLLLGWTPMLRRSVQGKATGRPRQVPQQRRATLAGVAEAGRDAVDRQQQRLSQLGRQILSGVAGGRDRRSRVTWR